MAVDLIGAFWSSLNYEPELKLSDSDIFLEPSRLWSGLETFFIDVLWKSCFYLLYLRGKLSLCNTVSAPAVPPMFLKYSVKFRDYKLFKSHFMYKNETMHK